jgi:transposase
VTTGGSERCNIDAPLESPHSAPWPSHAALTAPGCGGAVTHGWKQPLCPVHVSSVHRGQVRVRTDGHRMTAGERACLHMLGGVGGDCWGHVSYSGLDRRAVGADLTVDAVVGWKPGKPFRDHRQVTEGIIYRYRTGVSWRDLPAEFGPWQTVWKRHRRLAGDGTWDMVLAELLADADAGGLIDWQVSVDSTVNRAHQHGPNLTRAEQGTGGLGELQEAGRGAA